MPVRLNEVVIAGQGLLSAGGRGVAAGAEALLAGRCLFRPGTDRGWPAALAGLPGGFLPPELRPSATDSPFHGLLAALFDGVRLPADAALYLATTVGAIDRLEKSVLAGDAPPKTESLAALPDLWARRLGLDPARAQVVSAACASSTTALALAGAAIRRGEIDCAMVVGADVVSEFVLAGFSALMALDPGGARPFGAERKGITLGEGAAYALLMSRARAAREARPVLGVLAGWGLTCDANHLTGPSRDGAPLAAAIRAALRQAGCTPEDVTAICAHGTGTMYNDQMEMLAFKQVFGSGPRPVFSVKGGIGHTLGAAGLAEALLSVEFLRRGRIPPTIGMGAVDPAARGWVCAAAQTADSSRVMLSTNSGFGGVNAAVVLALSTRVEPEAADAAERPVRWLDAGPGSSAGPEPAADHELPRNFSRFSPDARQAYPVVAAALRRAGLDPVRQPALRIGIVAWGRAGSDAANREYFSDYVRTGRTLARGQLFAATLPTSVAAECAIACRLTGPLVYVAAPPDGGAARARDLARRWLEDGAADAVVVLASAPDGARADVAVPESLCGKDIR